MVELYYINHLACILRWIFVHYAIDKISRRAIHVNFFSAHSQQRKLQIRKNTVKSERKTGARDHSLQ